MKKITIAIGLLCFGSALMAQDLKINEDKAIHRLSNISDVTLGFGSNRYKTSVSSKLYYGFFNQKLKLGAGPRFSMFFSGSDHDFKPVESNPQQGALAVDRPLLAAFNLAGEIRYDVSRWLTVGFNIDLIGFGGGRDSIASYGSNSAVFNGPQSTRAPHLNYLTVSKYDKGQLDSEIFVALRPAEQWSIKIGFSHYISEIETRTGLDGENRYRLLSNLGFIGTEYRL